MEVFALADIRYFFLHPTFLSDHSLFIFGHNTALQGHHVDSNTAADTPTLVMFSSANVQQQDFKLWELKFLFELGWLFCLNDTHKQEQKWPYKAILRCQMSKWCKCAADSWIGSFHQVKNSNVRQICAVKRVCWIWLKKKKRGLKLDYYISPKQSNISFPLSPWDLKLLMLLWQNNNNILWTLSYK